MSDSESEGIPSKRPKGKCKFNDEWLECEEYKGWLKKTNSPHFAKCELCYAEFTIQYKGVSAISAHMNSEKHKANVKLSKTTESVKTLFAKSGQIADECAVAEICIAYHTVAHHLSYLSSDCSVKLMKQLFGDSKIMQWYALREN